MSLWETGDRRAADREGPRDPMPEATRAARQDMMLAVVLMVLAGTLWALEGLGGLLKDTTYERPSGYFLTTSSTFWGITHLVLGVITVLAGFALLRGAVWARTLGVVLASISLVVNFLFLPMQPLWAIVVISLDLIVIYALTVHVNKYLDV
jgi:hypothetical protein